MAIKKNMKKIMNQINTKYYHKNTIFGKNLLTTANKINSSRAIMFGAMMDQYVPLLHPTLPKMYTNFENMVGDYSSAYKKAETNLIVIDKIVKFPDFEEWSPYILLVYDEEKRKYDIIERKWGELLTETYGYKYNNGNLDSKKPGSIIEKDEVLYKSTSFDENMNYCMGTNLKAVYTLHPGTIEDALVLSESAAEALKSVQYDRQTVSLNDNDFLTNIYGTANDYQAFADIGEKLKSKIVANKRRISYSQALYDLKDENVNSVNFRTDSPYYTTESNSRMVDIDIYCNKDIEEIEECPYNEQILHYLRMQTDYYKKIVKTFEPIYESPKYSYSDDFAELYSRAKKILNPAVKFKDSNEKVFNNMIIEFVTENIVSVCVGNKFAGRYGKRNCQCLS